MPSRSPGAVIWFTGVAASGKSTVAAGVAQRLRALGLDVENLDADEVRQHLSPNLGFTPEARDENTKRLAWLAALLSKYGVNVLVAAESPLRYYRDRARAWCRRFVEVYVECPLEVCQQRDPKGLYARAARGEVKDLAGVHLPYEPPVHPEVHLRTHQMSVEECVQAVMDKLQELGYLSGEAASPPPSQPAQSGPYDEAEQRQVEERLKALGYI
jgi:adenylylsulfate kinase